MYGRLNREDYGKAKEFYICFFSGREYAPECVERYETIFRLVSELTLSPASRVLDIGSGSGEITKNLHPMFEAVFAFDLVLSPDMRLILNMSSRVRFAEVSLPYLPLADSSMDLVVFSEVIEHLYRRDQVLSIEALARVIRPGGFAILTTPNPIGIRSLLNAPLVLLRQLRGKPRYGQPIENWLKPAELQPMVRKWFSIEMMMGTNYTPPLVERMPRSARDCLFGLSEAIWRKRILTGLGEYQYYVLRRR